MKWKTYDRAQSMPLYLTEPQVSIEARNNGWFARGLFEGLLGVRVFPVFIVTFYWRVQVKAAKDKYRQYDTGRLRSDLYALLFLYSTRPTNSSANCSINTYKSPEHQNGQHDKILRITERPG